ncbi:type II secretion system protein GspE [Salmonella enterica subsp. enterica]|nr:type II secretion system protein GspE [Salmonella enterica subsp. enterica]MKP45263.1 type II secretion system protein GspE [Salmonella enterica subsp. enterica]
MKDAQLNTLCQRHQAVLINSASNSITVAVVDAPSHALLDALHFATQKQIDIVCWTRQQMENHRHKPDQAPSANAAKGGETAAQLLNQTLRSAMAKRASDIHLEPGASRYRIRLRIDGVLHILQDIAKETGLALTARLKVLGNLDIAEHRLPQDGQFTVDLAGDSISFRIATLPCKEGEKVVLRLLHQVEQTLDLDIIMVGEIRDGDTAEIAIKAAQTGHLVLSTLHTNSTSETLIRLQQMGVARWMISSALTLVVAQRLVRKLCPHCKQRLNDPVVLSPNLWPSALPRWQASGCQHCYHGFYGRTALFEVLTVTPTLRQLIASGASAQALEAHLQQTGTGTLFENGCRAVEQGMTSFEEILRVLGMPHER